MTQRRTAAIDRFNEMNRQDPRETAVDESSRPTQLREAERLEAWVVKRDPNPSEALLLAARCQHLQRFKFPRSDYPEGRTGYLKWRKDLMKKHADLAGQVLSECGFDDHVIAEVRKINLKQDLKNNLDVQKMEDALCLSFLEHEYSDFAQKYDDEKVVAIVQKTWMKMSVDGQKLALTIPLFGRAQDLVARALQG
jgi:hypothetical protein